MALIQISVFFSSLIGYAGTVYLPNGYGVDVHNVCITLHLFLYNFFFTAGFAISGAKKDCGEDTKSQTIQWTAKYSNTVTFSH